MQREPTFDEELLLWLGDEPPEVRAADAERVRDIAAEFARGFDSLARRRTRGDRVRVRAHASEHTRTTPLCGRSAHVWVAPATRSSPAVARD